MILVSCWREFAGPGGRASVLLTGGALEACQIWFIIAGFRPGRACSAAGPACWGCRRRQEQEMSNSLAKETTTQ